MLDSSDHTRRAGSLSANERLASTIYLAQPLFGLQKTCNMLFGRFSGIFPEPYAGVVSAAAYLAMCWGLLWFLHSRKIYLKV